MTKRLLVAAGLCCLFAVPAQSAELFSDFSQPFKPVVGATGSNQSFTEGGLSIFTDQGDFENAAMSAGKFLKFVEDFEEGNVGANGIASLAPPLAPGVPNLDINGSGLGFPNGLRATNMQMSVGDKVNNFLVVLGDGFAGNSTTVVGANTFVDSTVIELLETKTAVGFNIFDPIGGSGDYNVTVLDPAGSVLFDGNVSAGAANGSFLGVVSGGGIGSIEVAAALDGGELIDNIQLWVPEPASGLLGLVALLGLMATRRR